MTVKDAIYMLFHKFEPKELPLTYTKDVGNVTDLSLTAKEKSGFCAVKISFRLNGTVASGNDIVRLSNLSKDLVGSMCGYQNGNPIIVFVRSNAVIVRACGNISAGEVFIRGVLSLGGAP